MSYGNIQLQLDAIESQTVKTSLEESNLDFIRQRHMLRGTSSCFFPSILFVALLASALASTKPSWLSLSQCRGPTCSCKSLNKKRQNRWTHFAISIANNNRNTKCNRVIMLLSDTYFLGLLLYQNLPYFELSPFFFSRL